MTLLALLLACSPASVPALARPTEARLERFCRAESAAELKDAEALNKAYVQEVLLKDGWTYAGPLFNDGINCTTTLWTR